MVTCRGSLQPASAASPTSASMMMVFRMVCSSGSEGHVDAGEELSHRRLRQEIGLTEVELPDVVDLGVRSAVLGPGREVAARGGGAQGAGPRPPRPSGRSDVGARYLAQLDEAGVLVEPRFDGGRRPRPRLSLQRPS